LFRGSLQQLALKEKAIAVLRIRVGNSSGSQISAQAQIPNVKKPNTATQNSSVRTLGPLVTIDIDCGFPIKAYLLGPQARALNLGTGMGVTVSITTDAIQIMTE
jgi:hypothetical protein